MILQILEAIGLNPYLIFDFVLIGFLICVVWIVYLSTLFKGMIIPALKWSIKKEKWAFIDNGGIREEIKTYKNNSESLEYSDKKNKFMWPIPKGIEHELPNGVKFILASTSLGVCYNNGILGRELSEIKKVLSPKLIANTIDDRSKVMADHLTKDQNKMAVMGGIIGILFIVCLFCYLVLIKGLEYDACRIAVETAKQVSTTTINTLPPLD